MIKINVSHRRPFYQIEFTQVHDCCFQQWVPRNIPTLAPFLSEDTSQLNEFAIYLMTALAGWKIHPESGFVFPFKRKLSFQKRNCLTILSQCPTHNPTSSDRSHLGTCNSELPLGGWSHTQVDSNLTGVSSRQKAWEMKSWKKILLELFRTKMAKKFIWICQCAKKIYSVVGI